MVTNPYHPFWQTVHWCLVIGIVGLVLRLNATCFDATEIHSLIQIGLALAGVSGAKMWLGRKRQAATPRNSTETPPNTTETNSNSWFRWGR